jgi:glycosyltransferase involved in cell wall biosynthesis
MRIVIDLQGAQSKGSRNRGIGRYSLSLAQAIVRNQMGHEVIIVLSGLFPDTIEPIRAAFDDLLPQKNIRIWTAPGPVNAADPSNAWRRESAEKLREAFLIGLKPDIILISSIFEGLVDDAVTSIGTFSQSIPTAVIFYDLIPLIHSQIYLENSLVKSWYLEKIDHLKRANLWLAISESSRREGIEYLGLPEPLIVNVSTAADDRFQARFISPEDERRLRQKYGLKKSFLMYTGGIDYRKNIEGLICAFARLPGDLRRAHQLAIVCSAQSESRKALEDLARQNGLDEDEVVLTGYVPDDDLVSLYNLCRLFVFPSWHEGFGLPALEAMRCGAPVIAANSSSLPEVIGRPDALFDPFSEDAISAKITEVLENNAFREELISHSDEQAQKFSWSECARRAIAAIEQFFSAHHTMCRITPPLARRPKLAYISPLPPDRSGIAYYSAELLPELARYYDIEVIVTQPEVSDPWIKSHLPIRTVDWFIQHAESYDRKLYHFGNSAFHQHMFDLLNCFSGVVVLHDFYLSSIKAHLDFNGYAPGTCMRELYESHGYVAVCEGYYAKEKADIIFKYPCNFSIIQQAIGIIAHSKYSKILAKKWYKTVLDGDWEVIPHLRSPTKQAERMEARKKLGLEIDDFIICSFGILSPTKQNHRLLRAWLNSALPDDLRCQLIFVGEAQGGSYGAEIVSMIKKSGFGERIQITGWVNAERFHDYLAASDLAVQLRTLSRGETSGTILDCMNYGIATIVNANGSIAELSQDAVWMIPDEFEDAELIEAMEILWRDAERRLDLGKKAREVIQTCHSPRVCAEQYSMAIETFYASEKTGRHALIDALVQLDNFSPDEKTFMALAANISENLPLKQPASQLLVDVSRFMQLDVKFGIQLVIRSILKELIQNPPAGYRVEPVYFTKDRLGFRYARDFTLSFLECPPFGLADEPIEVYLGDIFLGLDPEPQLITAQVENLKYLHNRGLQIYFVLYDLLPILLPNSFKKEVGASYEKWLNSIIQFDGVLCTSIAVADELREWLNTNSLKRFRPLNISCFHPGSDIENCKPTQGLAKDASNVLAKIGGHISFLIVGTIELRRGHAQILAAFEQLWAECVDVNLVIVGKQGWKMEALVDSLRKHQELGKRLFWLDGISDEYLEKVYAASTCLIAASEGESFGLPLIEAARRKLPIISRDIPIFHEVAGEYPYYFNGKDPDDLANAVKEWLALYRSGLHRKSEDMPWLTWKQSTQQLLDIILRGHWQAEWFNHNVD